MHPMFHAASQEDNQFRRTKTIPTASEFQMFQSYKHPPFPKEHVTMHSYYPSYPSKTEVVLKMN